MFNKEIISELLKSTGKSKKDFLAAVFNPASKRGITYFDRIDNVNFTTAEKVADFFGVPMDLLRTGKRTNQGVIGNHNLVGNVNINSNFMAEIQYLRQMIAAKDEIIASNKMLIESKNEVIDSLKKEQKN